MKGGAFHNVVLLQPLREAVEGLGAQVLLEYPVEPGQRPRTVDLYFEWRGYRIVIEIEQSLARIGNDKEKARVLDVDLLTLVFPTPRLAAAAERKLDKLSTQGQQQSSVLRVMTFGVALQHLRHPELLERTLRAARARRIGSTLTGVNSRRK